MGIFIWKVLSDFYVHSSPMSLNCSLMDFRMTFSRCVQDVSYRECMSTISCTFYVSVRCLYKKKRFFPDDTLFFTKTDVSANVLYYKFSYRVFNADVNSKFHHSFAFVILDFSLRIRLLWKISLIHLCIWEHARVEKIFLHINDLAPR